MFFKTIMVHVSRTNDPAEFYLFILVKLTVSKSAWQVVDQLSREDILMLDLNTKPNATVAMNRKKDSILCTLGQIGAI